jgi:hypothetical protein
MATKEDFEHYEKLIGLGPTIRLLHEREKAKKKLERKRNKDRAEQLGGSRPDGRMNGFNISSGSIVAKMGGKRRSKKTKRGF